MRYRLTTDDFLIFRDGRPFGDAGMFGGRSLKWPFPQTLAGMVRSATGFARSPDFFRGQNKEANIAEILNIGIARLSPCIRRNEKWEPLMPLPADLVMTGGTIGYGKPGPLTLHPITFRSLSEGQGTDIANPDWLIPTLDLKDKPTRHAPFLANWSFFQDCLTGRVTENSKEPYEAVGISAPVTDIRVHNALGDRLVTEEGMLFSNEAFYLKVKEDDALLNLAIEFDVVNENGDDITGHAWLGGERKRVKLVQAESRFPACPDIVSGQQFLKLILTTHGDFGGWCPDWLKPDLNASSIDWVTLPGTEKKIRLRSAIVTGWDGVSGWDFVKRGPKAMKKLVRPGAVYLVEVKDPASAPEIAKHLWGASLCADTESRNNGYGQCVVGAASMDEK